MKTNILRIIFAVCTIGALFCITGFDCPDCNYVAQLTALFMFSAGALICTFLLESYDKNERD